MSFDLFNDFANLRQARVELHHHLLLAIEGLAAVNCLALLENLQLLGEPLAGFFFGLEPQSNFIFNLLIDLLDHGLDGFACLFYFLHETCIFLHLTLICVLNKVNLVFVGLLEAALQ